MEARGKRAAFSTRAVGAVCASTVPAASTGPSATSNASRFDLRQWWLQDQTTVLGGRNAGCDQDYPESDSETSRIRVWADPTARGEGRPPARGGNLPAPAQQPRCSGCGRRGPQYDTLSPRWFEFVPLWGLRVFFLYRMRRVACARCGGVRVERVPWAEGKHQLTTTTRGSWRGGRSG